MKGAIKKAEDLVASMGKVLPSSQTALRTAGVRCPKRACPAPKLLPTSSA